MWSKVSRLRKQHGNRDKAQNSALNPLLKAFCDLALTKVIIIYHVIIFYDAGINNSHQMTKPRRFEVMHFKSGGINHPTFKVIIRNQDKNNYHEY